MITRNNISGRPSASHQHGTFGVSHHHHARDRLSNIFNLQQQQPQAHQHGMNVNLTADEASGFHQLTTHSTRAGGSVLASIARRRRLSGAPQQQQVYAL